MSKKDQGHGVLMCAAGMHVYVTAYVF